MCISCSRHRYILVYSGQNRFCLLTYYFNYTNYKSLSLLLLISECCPLSKLDYSIIIIIVTLSLVTGPFFLALLLKQLIRTVQASSFRLHAFVTIPVAAIITGLIIHFV